MTLRKITYIELIKIGYFNRSTKGIDHHDNVTQGKISNQHRLCEIGHLRKKERIGQSICLTQAVKSIAFLRNS